MAVYVMSDLHGLKHRFDEMLKRISFCDSDDLYILGDVIDRGPDGIALYMEIRKHDNIHVLMGNHEHMMLEYFDALQEQEKGVYNVSIKERIARWNYNHNRLTLAQFDALTREEQQDLLSYLRQRPLVYPNLRVKDHYFYLVHAAPHPAFTTCGITLAYCKKEGMNPYEVLWKRMDVDTPIPEQRILIFGHTPTLFFQPNRPYAIWTKGANIKETNCIGIDCGCAANDEHTRLACVRLDDVEVFYV